MSFAHEVQSKDAEISAIINFWLISENMELLGKFIHPLFMNC